MALPLTCVGLPSPRYPQMFQLFQSRPSQNDPSFHDQLANTQYSGSEALPPVDRTVELLSGLSRAGRTELNSIYQAVRSSEHIRNEVLGAVVEHPSLIESPTRRALLLDALTTFSHEPLVQELAIVSLESAYLKNAERAVRAASLLVKSALSPSDGQGCLSAGLSLRLLKVASRYAPGGGDLSAAAAFVLLPLTGIPQHEPLRVHALARAWYVDRHQEKNPWLALLQSTPSRENVQYLAKVAEGRVPKSEAATLLRVIRTMAPLISELSVAVTVATAATRQICASLNLPKVISNAAIAGLSAVLMIGGKAIALSCEKDALNQDREWERVEAIARLAAIRASLAETPSGTQMRTVHFISGLLARVAHSRRQPLLVREAARVASYHEPMDPAELWNRTLQNGEFNQAERKLLPDIRA